MNLVIPTVTGSQIIKKRNRGPTPKTQIPMVTESVMEMSLYQAVYPLTPILIMMGHWTGRMTYHLTQLKLKISIKMVLETIQI